MLMFRPLMRYADFKGRASRTEYWLFAVLQGLWYALLIGLAVGAMGQSGAGKATAGVLVAFGLIVISLLGLIIPNYAVLVRRLHDSGRGAVWLCLMLPSVLSSVMAVGTIATAVGSVGLGASREAFVGTALVGLGAAGLLGMLGYIGQLVMFILTLLPGTRGENRFGPDPRDPSQRYGGGEQRLDEDRWDALIAEAKRGDPDQPYKPIFDFGPGPIQPEPVRRQEPAPFPAQPQPWSNPAWDPGVAPSRPFGRRGS